MAKICLTKQNIGRLKKKSSGNQELWKYHPAAKEEIYVTKGERHLTERLEKALPAEVEIYLQPYLDGIEPDIVLLRKSFGVVIIEVKDWDLRNHRIDKDGLWLYKREKKENPFEQATKYEDDINVELGLPINEYGTKLRLRSPIKKSQHCRSETIDKLSDSVKSGNENMLVHSMVYFHCTDREGIKKFFYDEENKKHLDDKGEDIKKILFWWVIGRDDVDRNDKINHGNLKHIWPSSSERVPFNDELYFKIKKKLKRPKFHKASDGKELLGIVDEQRKLIRSKPEHKKIKGIAGSGKTTVLVQRALSAHRRHKDSVLILFFNITLKHLITKKLYDYKVDFDPCSFDANTMHYHEFIKRNLFHLDIDYECYLNKVKKWKETDKNGMKEYESLSKIFRNSFESTHKYKSILIDEFQDYKEGWIRIIKEHFLEKDGELVIFADEKQNIYARDIKKSSTSDDDKMPNSTIPGRWNELKKPHRQYKYKNKHLVEIAVDFQKDVFYKKEKYNLNEVDPLKEERVGNPSGAPTRGNGKPDRNQQPDLIPEEFIFEVEFNKNIDEIIKYITYKIKELIDTKEAVEGQIVILGCLKDNLRSIESKIKDVLSLESMSTFITKEEMNYMKISENKLEEYDKKKKKIFNPYINKIKISTIHSFKGFDAHTLFLIIDSKDINEESIPELIYTGFTRAERNVFILSTPFQSEEYKKFFNLAKDLFYPAV